MGTFQFFGINCHQSHFFVISVDFDIRREQIFKNVKIYDSLRRTGRNVSVFNINSTGKQFLVLLQTFLAKYSFFASPNVERLLGEKELILQNAEYIQFPQQLNGYDCALFALATTLHLCSRRVVEQNTFSQDNVSELRRALHLVPYMRLQ